MTTDDSTVSVVGLGLMGSSLARAFLKKGLQVTVWNRSLGKAKILAAAGASIAESLRDCLQASKLVVVCIVDSPAFLQIFETIDHVPGEGRIMVDYTTGTPRQNRASERAARKAGIASYIHGAVMVFPWQVGEPESILWHSGSATAYRLVQDRLAALGSPMYIDEDPASAGLRETILITNFYASMTGFLQSMALLKTLHGYKQGDVKKFTTEILSPSLAAIGPALAAIAEQIDGRDYATKGLGATLGLQEVAIGHVVETYKECGLKADALEPILRMISARVASGGRDDELSGLVEYFPQGKD